MKRPQYISIIISAIVLVILLAFGRTKPQQQTAHTADDGHQHGAPAEAGALLPTSFSVDSVLDASKKALPLPQRSKLELMEKALGNNQTNEKIETYHQLSHFWRDSGRAFIPYAWYNAESARLENSEKSLNFAGHLFLSRLQQAGDDEMRRWMALQAKELFERSLQINPNNDSTKVGLGATYMFGGISNAPMQGIAKIREVAQKDSTHIFAQMTLAMGALISGQADRAQERLETINRIQPQNVEAILLLADLFEKKGDNEQAIKWYTKALPLTNGRNDIKAELEKRIAALKK